MELSQCINFLLTTAQNAVFRRLGAQLAEHNITPGQYGVLNCLWSEPGASPGRIAERLHLEASSVSSILDRMQKLELIRREIDPENRRNIRVFATQRGQSLEAPVSKIVEQVNDEVMSAFPQKEQELLKRSLLRIADMGK